jgi:hypothetical protein
VSDVRKQPVLVRCRSRRRARRGVTILVVLTLISITLAISYGLLRLQMTTARIQANSGRRSLAEQAALAGLSVGLNKMSKTGWAGVDTSISGALSSSESYQVTYTTGDSALQASDADYPKYPYRVTLRSVGSAIDPANPGITTKCSAEAVVELVPRALGSPPTGWSAIQLCTLFQVDDHRFEITPPCRIEGAVRLQGDVKLGEYYAWSDTPRTRYFSDLNAMRSRSLGDHRPLTGPVFLPSVKQDGATVGLLGALGITPIDTPVTSKVSFASPTGAFSYQLYPGGKAYAAPATATTLSNTSLSADPQMNPLGIFRCASSVTVGDNVTIEGTLIGRDDVRVTGQNVQIRSTSLPALSGSNTVVRLPALVISDDFDVSATAQGGIDGNILANDEFRIAQDASGPRLQILGKVASDEFQILGRDNWIWNDVIWITIWNLFNSQPATGRVDLFPVWLGQSAGGLPAMNPVPVLTIKPNPSPLTAHWQDLTQPIYVPASGDTGLRWDLVRWKLLSE